MFNQNPFGDSQADINNEVMNVTNMIGWQLAYKKGAGQLHCNDDIYETVYECLNWHLLEGLKGGMTQLLSMGVWSENERNLIINDLISLGGKVFATVMQNLYFVSGIKVTNEELNAIHKKHCAFLSNMEWVEKELAEHETSVQVMLQEQAEALAAKTQEQPQPELSPEMQEFMGSADGANPLQQAPEDWPFGKAPDNVVAIDGSDGNGELK